MTLDYISTVAGTAKLERPQGQQDRRERSGRAGTGRNKISWNGKVGKKPAAAGTYKLKLAVKRADGQTASETAKLALKKAK